MADVTVIEAISLLTKVSADTSSLIKKLSTRIDNIESIPGVKNKEKEKLVKKAEPVMVTDFGKAAEKDLAKLGGDAENERIRIEKEKNTNNQLLKLLGIAGAAALALKFLFDGEGITGLVQGFQKAYKIVANFANRAKGLIDDIGKRLGTFADDIGKKVGIIVDDVIAKTNTWAKSAKDGIKNAMDDIGRRLGTFGDDIAGGLTTVVNNAKNILDRLLQSNNAVGLKAAVKKLREARGASIQKYGEYGMENLVFKELRNAGYIDKVRKVGLELKSKSLSL